MNTLCILFIYFTEQASVQTNDLFGVMAGGTVSNDVSGDMVSN